MSDTETKLFEDYAFPGSIFWVKVTDLTVFRRWEREHLIDYGADAGFPTTITGTAISQDDSVHVLGKSDRETKEFDLTIKSDVCRTQEWERIRALEELAVKNDGTTPELRIRALIFEELNKNPPTATLLVYHRPWAIE